MKIFYKILKLLVLVFFTSTYACKNSTKIKSAEDFVDTYDTQSVLKAEDSIAYRNALLPLWEYNHKSGVEMPIKIREVDTEAISAQNLIDILNFQYEDKVYLKYHKLSGDTLYVKIDDSTFLTQQMGTMGAEAYLSIATYTLTELDYVNTVHFNFKEGDHAVPGVYSRDYFVKRNKQRIREN